MVRRSMRLISLAIALALMCLTPVFNMADDSSSARRRTRLITLERTVCFGACPNYKLTIYSDGWVEYEGIRFVKKMGKATGKISRAQLNDLVERFTNIHYFKFPDLIEPGQKSCPQSATDMPSANTSLTWQGRHKEVRHYHGCRGPSSLDRLTELENEIDRVVNVKQWTGK